MKIFIAFFIFCLVLFIYLHIQFHLKKSNDLEIYEIEDASKDKLEEICDLRQPVLIDFDNQKIIDTTTRKFILENYHAFEIIIMNYMFYFHYRLQINYLMKTKMLYIFPKIILIF